MKEKQFYLSNSVLQYGICPEGLPTLTPKAALIRALKTKRYSHDARDKLVSLAK